MGSKVLNLLKPVAELAATVTGNPELVPLIEGGTSLAQGKGIGKSLLNAGLAFGGQEVGGALGNAFPQTFGSTFGTGGNSLTDLLGSTSGAGSLTGAGTIGGDISGAFGGASRDPVLGTDKFDGSFTNPITNGHDPVLGINKFTGGTTNPVFGSGVSGDIAQGLASGTGYAPGAASPSNYAIAGGGASSFAAAPGASSSGGNWGKYLLPALGAASTIGSNFAAQGQLSDATKSANAALQPYNATGQAANTAAGNYLGLNGSGNSGATSQAILAASPGYQFARDQGDLALQRQLAASGGLNSGAAMKAAEQFGTGLANQTGQQYYSNLAQTAGQGLNAAGGIGNNTTALGTARGAATIGTGNTLAQLLSGIGGRRVTGYGANGPIYSGGF